ncbi:tetratricopeptide repeat protein [Kordiimonas sp.]|uniref:tetratricopeptide repeat protein n=1 Tax=Kordiimonas sp. TaxID=1970157 RepID=UPI003A8E7DE1
MIQESRTFLASVLCVVVAACTTSAPGKRVTEDVGPVSAYARNNLAINNPSGIIKVGEGFEKAGDYAGALALFRQALAAAPDLLEAKIAVARVLIPLGRDTEAVEALSALLEQHPQSRMTRMALVDAQVASGTYESASNTFAPLLVGASAPEVYDMAGRLAFVAGNSDRALQYFDAALKLDANHLQTLRHLALAYAINAKFESAVALLKPAMDHPGSQLDAQRTLATIYALSGQKSAALHIARSAMASEEANNMRVFYELLPRLSRLEQAEALMFDRVPKEAILHLRR